MSNHNNIQLPPQLQQKLIYVASLDGTTPEALLAKYVAIGLRRAWDQMVPGHQLESGMGPEFFKTYLR